MASLYQHRDGNKYKSFLIILLAFVFISLIGWGASWYFESQFIVYIAVIFGSGISFFSYWGSHKMVLSMAKAKKANREEYRETINLLENLSITAGLPSPELYIIDDPSPNAFATGRSPKHSVVAVTTGLLEVLDRSELEGVIAHELSHIGNRDTLVMATIFGIAGIVAILTDFFIHSFMFGGGRDRTLVTILITIAVAVLASIAATMIKFAVSRKREYLADASAALLTRYPEGLARALEKISNSPTSLKHKNHATAFFYIDDPFIKAKGKKGLIDGLFATHPPVEKRIAALRYKDIK